MRQFKVFAAACALLAALSFSASAAESKTVLEIHRAAELYFRNKNWTPFAASVRLSFYKQDQIQSSCSGTLLFDPMKKKLLMDCFGPSGNAVFVFRNDDMRFLLFLPSMSQAWDGNIFDLEYSDEFDSHLRPLDLYRAISPEAFSESEVTAAYGVREGMELEIAKPYRGRSYLARRLILDRGGVKSETFLAPDQTPLTVVLRPEFARIENKYDKANPFFYFAPLTQVIHPETGDKTVMEITKVRMHKNFPEEAWNVWLPDGIEAMPIATA